MPSKEFDLIFARYFVLKLPRCVEFSRVVTTEKKKKSFFRPVTNNEFKFILERYCYKYTFFFRKNFNPFCNTRENSKLFGRSFNKM